jgi:uncharacterized membrane protein YgdD (TMEM256/DUF423 family)
MTNLNEIKIMRTTPRSNALIVVSALLGAIGVIAGAFGAHVLRETLEAAGTAEVWRTAVLYNLVHAVAGVAVASNDKRLRAGPIWLWLAGVVLFSGSLYFLALGGPRWLGPVTPIGGVLLIAGWLWLAISTFSGRREGLD